MSHAMRLQETAQEALDNLTQERGELVTLTSAELYAYTTAIGSLGNLVRVLDSVHEQQRA